MTFGAEIAEPEQRENNDRGRRARGDREPCQAPFVGEAARGIYF